MPDRARLAAAGSRAQYAAAWLQRHAQDAPPLVRQFLTLDVPYLLSLTEGLTEGLTDRRGSVAELVNAVRTADLLVQLVNLTRLADQATSSSADPALWRARESDLQEGLDGLRPDQARTLAEAAVRALAETGWQADTPARGWEPGS